jgi:hypothetical protein
MDIGAIVSRARKAAADNTPTILTAIGVTGTITTAILAGKASFRAAEFLQEAQGKRSFHEGEIEPLPNKEKLELVWKEYIPAVTTGAATVACIITANRVSSRRAAALASAYSITQEAFKEYRGKVFEKVGEKKEQVVRDEIAQERVNRTPPGPMIIANDKVLCHDLYSGRYFESDKETIRRAVNDINYKLINEDYASLTDFWELIGLPSTSDSDEIGWTIDSKFEVDFASALTTDGKPVMTIDFRTSPIRSFYRRY